MSASDTTHRVKIRGLYATALTKLLSYRGYIVANPSTEIRRRFGLASVDETWDILIRDREDRQGVSLLGGAEKVWQVVQVLREHLLDAAIISFGSSADNESLSHAQIEFPRISKEHLDQLRSAVVPTLAKHHRFRVIDFQRLERLESDLAQHPEKEEILGQEAFLESIIFELQKSERVAIEHVKPCGKPIHPRVGRLLEVDSDRFTMKRSFFKGRYDGLDIPIETGDYGITEVQEGKWYIKHSYYSREGKLKGEYYNMSTPVELYPYGARYLDLEIDIVRRPGEEPFMVDQEKFAALAREGIIGYALEKKTLEAAEDLMRQLNG